MRSRRGGFTLIELILVMVVIFTLATIVAPRFSDSFPSLQVRTSTERLFAWARKARTDAALTGCRQRLLMDSSKKKFWIEVESRPLKEAGKFKKLSGAWEEVQLPDEILFELIEGAETDPNDSARRYIEFRPDGTSTEATVILSNENGDRQTLRVEAATSKIYIELAKEDQ
ncbi:MAG TPA: GspH/FimT family pseudopilin [Planctomycetota bacterium]|jgi:prepilin-type N-terminal cleavage/methylation domain-containing protein|nr:GspH/FimT family pseudopilin [Planctomycetota bacterium]